MDITVRLMKHHEADEVQKIGRKAFSAFESLWVSKPKEAMVAVCEGKIVGALLFKYFMAGNKKIGYLDFGFVHPDYKSKKIGGVLYKKGIDYLWEQGCDALSALVKDDNVASWGLLVKNNFSAISIPALIKHFGFGGMLKNYFALPFFISIGMDYYVAFKEDSCELSKKGNAKQMIAYLATNSLLFLVMIMWGTKDIGAFYAALMGMLAGNIIFTYIGTVFSKRKWEFRFNNGGFIVCAFICMMAVFPMNANWYPKKYENTKACKKDMGIASLASWIFVFAITLISMLNINTHHIFSYLQNIGMMFLIYKAIIFYPFAAFGGSRLFDYNKWIYGITTVLSVLLIITSKVFL